MKKRIYKSPEIKVFYVNTRASLLAGSLGSEDTPYLNILIIDEISEGGQAD